MIFVSLISAMQLRSSNRGLICSRLVKYWNHLKVLRMLSKPFKEIGTILILSIFSWIVWKLIPTTLNDALYNIDYELRNPFLRGEYNIRIISIAEVIKYLILSCLLTTSIFFSFWKEKAFKPKLSYPIAFSIFTVTFFIACYFLDQNAKGAYMVNWLGDDFPYGFRFIFFFILFPFVLLAITYNSLRIIGIRNVPFFFTLGLLAAYIPFKILGQHFFNMPGLRAAVASGYFVFFITLFLGLYFLLINRNMDTALS